MLSLLFIAAVRTSTTTPDEAFARFTNWVKTHPYFGVDFLADGTVHGSLIIKQPKTFRLEFKTAGVDYAMIRAGDTGIEFDRAAKTYAEGLFGPRLFDFESQFSDYPTTMTPRMLMHGQLKAIIDNMRPRVVSEAGGLIKIEATPPAGGEKNRALITMDTQGKLLHFQIHSEGPMGTSDQSFDFSNYRLNPPVNLDTHAPMGYFAFSLPVFIYPLETGQTMQLGAWTDSRGSSVVADEFLKGKTLVAIMDPSQEPSRRALAHLGDLTTALRGAAKVVVLTTKRDSSGRIGDPAVTILTDPTGTNFRRYAATGTPMYYLVENKKVLRLWLGDDEETRGATFRDMAMAASGK